MTPQEAFDACSQHDFFSIREITQLSYCPPEDLHLFRAVMRGRVNELMALDMISGQANKRKNSVLLDSSHAKPILQKLYPDSEETDHGQVYGFESSSLRVGALHLPSPDNILVVNDNPREFGEASLSRNWKYWWKKKKRFKNTRDHFRGLGGYFSGLLTPVHCNLIMTRKVYEKRKSLGLVRKNVPTNFTQMPYSREEFEEFFESILPKNTPYQPQTEIPKVHWRELLEIPETIYMNEDELIEV